MSLVNFVLRHLIVFGFLAYLGLGVYFHERLFPGLKPSLAKLSGPSSGLALKQGTVKASLEPQAPAPGTTAATPVIEANPTIIDPAAISEPTGILDAQPGAKAVEAQAQPAPYVASDAYQFRPQDAEPAASAAPTAPTEADVLYKAMMTQARSQVEKEDWAGAEAAYLRLNLEYPDRAEPYGELGNLYLYRKEHDKAADAYRQAALRLKGADQAQRLESLLEVLEQIAPDKAKELRERLSKP